MDFVKLQQQLEDGKKLALRFKDGSTVFSHNPPLKLYPLILKLHPAVEYWTEPDGTNPLFYVDSAKKFDYLVEYGFDIYAKDSEGLGLHDCLDVSLFDNLSLKALQKFGGDDKVFQDYLVTRVKEGILEQIYDAIVEDGMNLEEIIKTFSEITFDEELIDSLILLGGKDGAEHIKIADNKDEEDFTFQTWKMIVQENGGPIEDLVEMMGGSTTQGLASGSTTQGLASGSTTQGLAPGSTSRLLHYKMIGYQPELDNTSVHTPHSEDHSWVFTTDAHNTYKTFTTKEGYQMLDDLADQLELVLMSLRNTPGFDEAEGFKIYTEKENLKSGATWSDEEYANPSFLYWYCLNKAVQRFPETIEMMNSAAELKVLEQYRKVTGTGTVTNATIVSLGGGCSYELLAVKAVFKKHFPHVKLRLVSLDYEPLWGKIVEPLGIEFDTIDFNKPVEELQAQLDKYNTDFYVMSFVYRTYIKQRHADFVKYLCKSSFGIFINDRNTEYLSFGMMTYKLSKDGFLTLISDQFEGYPYVEALTNRGFPIPIYKDTPWVKPGNTVRTSGDSKRPGGDRPSGPRPGGDRPGGDRPSGPRPGGQRR